MIMKNAADQEGAVPAPGAALAAVGGDEGAGLRAATTITVARW